MRQGYKCGEGSDFYSARRHGSMDPPIHVRIAPDDERQWFYVNKSHDWRMFRLNHKQASRVAAIVLSSLPPWAPEYEEMYYRPLSDFVSEDALKGDFVRACQGEETIIERIWRSINNGVELPPTPRTYLSIYRWLRMLSRIEVPEPVINIVSMDRYR